MYDWSNARPRAARRGWKRWSAVAAISVCTAIVAGCSSSGGGSHGAGNGSTGTAGSSAGNASNKSAINVLEFDPKSAVFGYPALSFTSSLYGQYISANGGINGHPLNVITCDTKGTAAGTLACAREAVSDHVAAVVNPVDIFGGTYVSILAAAKIPIIGAVAGSPPENTNPYVFNTAPFLSTSGYGYAAKLAGCKNTGLLSPSAQPNLGTWIQNGFKALGLNLSSTSTFGPTTTDFSTSVAKATTNADCLVLYVAPGQEGPALAAVKATGKHLTIIAPGLDPAVQAQFQSILQGSVFVEILPQYDDPVFASLRQALQGHEPPASYQESTFGRGPWTSFTFFTNVAKTIKGTVDNTSMYAALNQATSVSSSGIFPDLDFSKSLGLNGQFSRQFNPYVDFQKLSGDQLTQLGDQKWVSMVSTWNAGTS